MRRAFFFRSKTVALFSHFPLFLFPLSRLLSPIRARQRLRQLRVSTAQREPPRRRRQSRKRLLFPSSLVVDPSSSKDPQKNDLDRRGARRPSARVRPFPPGARPRRGRVGEGGRGEGFRSAGGEGQGETSWKKKRKKKNSIGAVVVVALLALSLNLDLLQKKILELLKNSSSASS